MDYIHLQKLRTGKHRVVITNGNGKLVFAGESMNRKIDADNLRDEYHVNHKFTIGSDLRPLHKFALNAGPKKSPKKQK